MSSKTREAEKRRERAAADEAAEIEAARLARRNVYERIEDLQDIYDVREFLHQLMTALHINEMALPWEYDL